LGTRQENAKIPEFLVADSPARSWRDAYSLIVKHKPIPGGYSCEESHATPDVGASLWKAVDWEENGT
jgi:hypothetical protein